MTHLLHRDAPPLYERCEIAYRREFFTSPDQTVLPDSDHVRALGASYRERGAFTNIDLELHDNPYARAGYEHITRDFRAGYGAGELSHYSTMPGWVKLPPFSEEELERARRDGDEWFSVLGGYVSAFSPSFYCYSDSADDWETRVRYMVCECRRLDPAMPVYPFIWWLYHPFAGDIKGTEVPTQYWERMLCVLYELCDGVILWGGYKTEWDESARWLDTTRRFVAAPIATIARHYT